MEPDDDDDEEEQQGEGGERFLGIFLRLLCDMLPAVITTDEGRSIFIRLS